MFTYLSGNWLFVNLAQGDEKDKFLAEFANVCSKCSWPIVWVVIFNIIKKPSEK